MQSKIKAVFSAERIMTEDSDEARELYNQGRYGRLVDNKVQLSHVEAMYLIEKGKIGSFYSLLWLQHSGT